MSDFVRVYPDTPCQPDGAHHPHRWECLDPDCEGPDTPCWFSPLLCCVCGNPWPCTTKRRHEFDRRAPGED